MDGLILSYLSDLGPIPIVNLGDTLFDQTVTQKLSILGMSIILMGTGSPEIRTQRYMKIHGPIPLPYTPTHEVLCIPFNLKADFGSEDERIVSHGRECILWFIYEIKNRNQIFSNSKNIETLTTECLSTFKFESQLNDATPIIELFNNLKQIDYSSGKESEEVVKKLPPIDERSFLLYELTDEKALRILLEFKNLKSRELLIIVDVEKSSINMLKLKTGINPSLVNTAMTETKMVNERLFKNFKINIITSEQMIQTFLQKAKVYYESFKIPYQL
jgi:hypothetical protein